MHQHTDPAITVRDVTKRFGATIALDGASFAIRRAEAHALLGENGAGKSTAVKILSGLLQPDSGELSVFGEEVALQSPRHAHRLGIQTAYQEMTLIPDLTVAQNLLLPYQPTVAGQIRGRRGLARTRHLLDELGIGEIDPRAEIRDLDLPSRQKLEIAKALGRNPSILLLDEPTSALSGRDVDWLGWLIQDLCSKGVTIVFISHRLPEVRAYCDSLSILRNGQHVGTHAVGDLSDDEIVELVAGRSITRSQARNRGQSVAADARPLLSGRHLTAEGRLRDISLDLYPGEILGVSGLQGMGQLALFQAFFGMTHLSGGEIRVDGERMTLSSPADAIRSRIGVSMLPEDRKTEGVFLHLPGQQNVSLPVIERFSRWGWIDKTAERRAVDQMLAQVNVHPRALYKAVSSFSGGNQQKIALAKWLLARSRVLLMFDPTRGVDVGTKEEIYELMRQFADNGGAILFYSTEIPELVTLCDRILGIYRGEIIEELMGDEITEDRILRAVIGQESLVEENRVVS
ncbi:sugar ABC transporter ATP-binding protein [Aquisalimonas lutea]|uniref:sugar ABC transporter ATP-binding protein n=1 Tax=Aquisalimonas lutea TaxID=1327750 RepID=UPI0025B5211D|nr:sugar ABC transporter ATP-binding protein [Aquisalimonas lutea]MDN3516570.1 sugar ABC transporter ATP-binding protein [Aquisalimonas lutea]